MGQVIVKLPRLIAETIGQISISVDANTVRDAMAVVAEHPKLRPLLFDETGQLRERLLLLRNGKLTPARPAPADTISDRDELEVVMSVWGG
ncbi:MAG: hypothetical protein QM770_13410 [Tepidisphaeraceae bacterium]